MERTSFFIRPWQFAGWTYRAVDKSGNVYYFRELPMLSNGAWFPANHYLQCEYGGRYNKEWSERNFDTSLQTQEQYSQACEDYIKLLTMGDPSLRGLYIRCEHYCIHGMNYAIPDTLAGEFRKDVKELASMDLYDKYNQYFLEEGNIIYVKAVKQ